MGLKRPHKEALRGLPAGYERELGNSIVLIVKFKQNQLWPGGANS